MSSTDRFIELAAELLGGSDAAQRARRSYKRRLRSVFKALKVGAMLLAAAIAIPAAMIPAGLLLGPKGYEGLFLAPASVLVAWAVILLVAYRSRATPRVIAKSNLPQLPANTEAWLDDQRATLPAEAQTTLDAIALRLATLQPQVQGIDAQHPFAMELRRLLAEELPDLVHSYQKVPRALQQQPLHGGPSPDRRLAAGLATIDDEIARVQTRLAADDLNTMATQQRYLEIKYKDGDKG